jgi:pimeloyl-ACP methyl ester carboxylesterase
MVVMTLASKYPAYYSRLVLVASGPIGGLKFGPVETKEELFALPYVAFAEEAL